MEGFRLRNHGQLRTLSSTSAFAPSMPHGRRPRRAIMRGKPLRSRRGQRFGGVRPMTWPTRNSSGPRPHTSDPQLRRNFGGSKSSTTSEARAQQHPLRAAGGSLATEQREAQENLPTSSAVGGSASSKRRETQADHSGPGRCQPATFERRPRAHGQSQPMTCAYPTHAYQLQFSSVQFYQLPDRPQGATAAPRLFRHLGPCSLRPRLPRRLR